MPRSRFFGFGRVNLLKKVKVDGEWKFCPAVVEPGRKLNDLVRVKGKIETHSEGTYYLEWREQGQRRRQPVHNRALVFEQARLKGLELESQRKPPEIASLPESPLPVPVDTASLPQPFVAQPVVAQPLVAHRFPAVTTLPIFEMPAAHLIWRGIESYLQELIGNAVRSQLANLGLITQAAAPTGGPAKAGATAPIAGEPLPKEAVAPPPPGSGPLISAAIDSYLKDVEPPQREQKTYDEYRLVLYKFRDTCKRRYIEEVDRDDLLDFRRLLYSSGNEARTVFNRMGVVLQLLNKSQRSRSNS